MTPEQCMTWRIVLAGAAMGLAVIAAFVAGAWMFVDIVRGLL